MDAYGVSDGQEKELKQKMRQADLREQDITEQFIRSSGKGGQNVNKVATCVYLLHRPTGMSVKCQDERSQGRNRYIARCRLVEKIQKLRDKEERARIYEQEKKRRQERRRNKKAKETILENKRHKSQKKENRRRIRPQEMDKYS